MNAAGFFADYDAFGERRTGGEGDLAAAAWLRDRAAAAAVGAVWPKVDAAEDRICQSIGTSAGRFSDWAKSRRG